MQADARYRKQPKMFWAQVKLLSEELGYSDRRTGTLRRYTVEDVHAAYQRRNLSVAHLGDLDDPSEEAWDLVSYLNYRADVLETVAKPNLMDREQARAEFELLYNDYPDVQCRLPMNKQKGDKRHYSFLTCIVNILTEQVLGPGAFVDDPRRLITFTSTGDRPVRTFARRMDGAYPGINNPTACWEIKEYYGTTTFGSRVAGGVYETMLDGAEIEELRESAHIGVSHYLMVDDRYTWWDCGRSYLCRIVDMLHTGAVDEVLIGREVLSRWPRIVGQWVGRLPPQL